MRALIITIVFLVFPGVQFASSYERMIEKEMSERYDLAALTAFVRDLVRDHPVVDGVSPAKSRISNKWRVEKVDPPRRMRIGDWVIWDPKDEDSSFKLYYVFDKNHSVTAHVKRLAKDKFVLEGVAIEEWVSLK